MEGFRAFRLLAEAALEQLEFGVAEKAFVRFEDYQARAQGRSRSRRSGQKGGCLCLPFVSTKLRASSSSSASAFWTADVRSVVVEGHRSSFQCQCCEDDRVKQKAEAWQRHGLSGGSNMWSSGASGVSDFAQCRSPKPRHARGCSEIATCEVAAYFQRFDEAESLYREIDRKARALSGCRTLPNSLEPYGFTVSVALT